jgi:catechol 2,3-dioxygenase-like lactoylglutathione lyase family enzyme
MKLQTVSVFVDDQQRALEFYTGVLGFTVVADVPLGEFRWLTVESPDQPGGTHLSLEPKNHPAVPPFTAAISADGIPFLQLGVDDLQAEHERLLAAGVRFTMPPTPAGPVIVAVLDDTVGNLLQLAQLVG